MLKRNFIKVYTKFKLEFYKKIFVNFEKREASLTALEIFSVEVIFALKNPTIQEFANFIGLSSPNAAYRVNSLIKKGYVVKIQSEKDKREYNLEVTDKFLKYYGLTYEYTEEVIERIRNRFTKEEIEQFETMLGIISDELMFETKLKEDEF